MSLQDLFKEVFNYNELTGDFVWRRDNKIAGWIDNGYQRVKFGNTKYYVTDVIWTMMTGEWPMFTIDHIETYGVKYGYANRWSNLRRATTQENGRNRKLHRNNTSGFTGVSWNEKSSVWIAHITINYSTKVIGRFSIKEDAIAARLKAELEIFKEFTPD